MNLYKQLFSLIFIISMLFANTVLASSDAVKSRIIVIDETPRYH